MSVDDPPSYAAAIERVPRPAMIGNIYPDRTTAALSASDPRWKVHPPTGVLPPKVLQELKEAISSLPYAPTHSDASCQVHMPQPSAPLLSSIGGGTANVSTVVEAPGGAEKAKRLKTSNERQTLELLKKKRKLEAQLRKLEGELHQARAKPRS
ncbi:MAG: hypothetical protein ACREPC_10095 [Stenotrophomonas sp.]|uniref:hypothetical protein n=1 Tax=Stenotrophomonas sp. TaxID=69392 RepID=UPI003D6D3ABE